MGVDSDQCSQIDLTRILRALRSAPFSRSLCVSLLSLFFVALSVSDANAADNVAELLSAEGAVEGKVQSPNWMPVQTGQGFVLNDSIRTLALSRAGVRFSSGYLLRMNEKTTVSFDKQPSQPKSRISVLQGVGYFFSRKPEDSPSIETPHISASVRGTEFSVAVSGDETVVSVLDGAVHAENQYGSVDLSKGEEAVARAGQAPVKRILVRPLDAVQWSLYYPAVLQTTDFRDLISQANEKEKQGFEILQSGKLVEAVKYFQLPTATSTYGRALVQYKEGSAATALETVRAYRGEPSIGLRLFEASLLLSAGQVEQASQVLAAVRRETSASAPDREQIQGIEAAQSAVVATVRQEKSRAEELALIAVEKAPRSAASHLALGIVRQSQFRLEEARSALEKAVSLDPTSGVAQARLAELALGLGDRDSALTHAQAAIALDAKNPYALSVLGFAKLVDGNTEGAAHEFLKARAAESDFALAALGLGLTEIRQGKMSEGRSHLELAAQLDPAVSLYRSYLGKAYYEEEKSDLSLHEYERAIELDPLDPTPFLYRAYTKLESHDPIGALEDLHESQARNDNRAVFRSRLLLDQDEGTRSSGLGQIYNRLNFNELARVQAIGALNKDYSNYSAHFLLADLYRDTQLNSRAQVTENLIGRLLSPVNFNANDLNIGGEAGLNEYTTLFNRPVDRRKLQVIANSQSNTYGGRADYTAANDRVGFNLGYDGSYRHGFRENDWSRNHQLFNLGQFGITPNDTLVWDAALTASDQGDLIINHDPESEDSDFESKFDGVLVRGGYHRRINTGLHFIGQTFYSYGDFNGKDRNNPDRLSFLNVTENGAPVTPEPFFLDAFTDQDTNIKQHLGRSDAQFIWDTQTVSLVAGASVSIERLESEEDAVVTNAGTEPVLSFIEGLPLSSEADVNEYTNQTFLYSSWHLLPTLDVDAGLVYSWLEYQDNSFQTPFVEDTYTDDQFGPKAGLRYQLCDNASLRLAYSESLDRTGRGGLGQLEPTYVGGFNQVFDGVRGSEQQLYAAGVDLNFSKHTFVGLSYQRRNVDLHVPIVTGGLEIDRETLSPADVRRLERLDGGADVDRVSSYLYQILNSSFAARLDYQFERFLEDDPFPETQTNRAVAGLNYFHPSGFFAFGESAFRYQERAGALDPKETEDFWVLDAGAGYELDHHQGAIALRFNNLLDQSFRYSTIADEDPVLPRFGAILSLHLNF